MANEVLEKVVDTTNVAEGGGGLLNNAQQDRFIDYMWDSTVLGREVRKRRMRSNTEEIDKIGVGERIAKLATEAVDTGVNAAVQFTKISLTTKKIRLDWELSTESLEDNIEGAALEDHIARLLATQFGNDLEDLAINGDTDSADPLLKSFDGWKKLAFDGATVVSHGGNGLDRVAFNKALKAMPRRFMQRRGDLKFYVGTGVIQDYLYSLTDLATSPESIAESVIRNGPVRTEGGAGFATAYAFGLPVLEVPLFDEAADGTYSGQTGNHTYMELTYPQNRLWGIKRDITVYREFKPKKDTTEYTIYTRTGVQWENLDALVVISNIKVSE